MKWTPEVIEKLKALRALGLTGEQIGVRLGVSGSIVRKAVSYYIYGKRKDPRPYRAKSGEPLGPEMSDARYQKDCRLGSQILREACLDLFCRTANRYCINLDDAMACHLGFHAPPKLIRAPLKTSSAERLAA